MTDQRCFMSNYINICYLINKEYCDLTLQSIKYIKKFYKCKKYDLRFYIISNDNLSINGMDIIHIQNPNHNLYWDWQRVYIPELLDVNKCIYLDSDTVTTTCISKLWEVNLHDKIIGAVRHYNYPTFQDAKNRFIHYEKYFESFSVELLGKPFFNSGVLVIDCNKWNEFMVREKCMDDFKLSGLPMNEPGMNRILHGKWKELDIKWNYKPTGSYTKANITHYYGEYYSYKPTHDMFKLRD